jgi:hypothetical protein
MPVTELLKTYARQNNNVPAIRSVFKKGDCADYRGRHLQPCHRPEELSSSIPITRQQSA